MARGLRACNPAKSWRGKVLTPQACHVRSPAEDPREDPDPMLLEAAYLPLRPTTAVPPAVRLDDDVSLVGRRVEGSEIPDHLGKLVFIELAGDQCTRSMDPVDTVGLLLLPEAGRGMAGQQGYWAPDQELAPTGPAWRPSSTPLGQNADAALELYEQACSSPLLGFRRLEPIWASTWTLNCHKGVTMTSVWTLRWLSFPVLGLPMLLDFSRLSPSSMSLTPGNMHRHRVLSQTSSPPSRNP